MAKTVNQLDAIQALTGNELIAVHQDGELRKMPFPRVATRESNGILTVGQRPFLTLGTAVEFTETAPGAVSAEVEVAMAGVKAFDPVLLVPSDVGDYYFSAYCSVDGTVVMRFRNHSDASASPSFFFKLVALLLN